MNAIRQLGLFLTESCNLACPYCFAANMERRYIKRRTARRALELVLGQDNPAMQVGITFWGGEPLLRFELLAELVQYAEQLAQSSGKRLLLAVPTNLTLLTEPILDFLQQHEVYLSLSLDGGEQAQGLRRMAGGGSSFALVLQKLELLRRRLGSALPPARTTVSPQTADSFFRNVCFLLDQGIRQVYFAPVVEAQWERASLEAFEAQQLLLAELWARRLEAGVRLSFSSWDKQLARRELLRRDAVAAARRQITCGAGSSMLAVDIHGDLYPCHRFVFYDKKQRGMKLGNLAQGLPRAEQLQALMQLDPRRVGRADQPCESCASADRCYNLCPALNYSLSGEIHQMDRRLCELWNVEQRVVDWLEARLGQHLEQRRYVEQYLMRTYGSSGLSASVAALFARLDDTDAERLTDRADAILQRVLRQRSRTKR